MSRIGKLTAGIGGMVLSLAMAACSDLSQGQTTVTLAEGETGQTLPPGGDPPAVIVAGLSVTTSDMAEMPQLLQALRDVVLSEAAEYSAYLQVLGMTGRSTTDVMVLGEASFASPPDNPHTAETWRAETAQKLIDDVVAKLENFTPADSSDPFGVLRPMADVLTDPNLSGAKRLGIILGDVISTTPGCNVNVYFGGPAPVAPISELAARCMDDGQYPDLGGAPIWVIGGGVDIDDDLPASVALGVRDLTVEIVDQSHGHLERWVAHPAPGGG